MKHFDEKIKKLMEDVTSSAFGTAAAGFTAGALPANTDKGYAPGDARIPSYLGAKKRRGRRLIPMQRRNLT